MSGTDVRPEVSPGRARVTRTRAAWRSLRRDRVLQAALAMILAQLVFRAWATYGSWFRYDDFNFMSRMMNDGPGFGTAFREYSGHVRPIGMWLAWLANAVAPFDFHFVATVMLVLQLVADVGLLVLLVRLFGSRPGILPPLALYLFSVISVPVSIWWASAVSQIPLQAVLFWALSAHVTYLRSGRARHALVVALWLVVGFGFHEKTLLVIGALAIVSLLYFASGTLHQRLVSLWRRYWLGICLYALLGAAYLVLYIRTALTFDPGRAGQDGLGEVVSNMVVEVWLPGVVGGPLHWDFLGPNTFPRPGAPLILAAAAVVFLVLRELARSRRRSMRALWLLGFFLASDIVLVFAGRASYVGSLISLDYRYQGELAAVSAIALACAALPIRGAVETVEKVGTSWLVDAPRRVTVLTTIVSVLGTVSAGQVAWQWQHEAPARTYFGHLFTDLSAAGVPVPLVDGTVPSDLMFALSYPENALSHLLHDDPHGADFVDVATDHLFVVDGEGHVVPAVVPATRRALPGPHQGCGYRIRSKPVTIPLDGPLVFGGWWVRMGYITNAVTPVRVTAGDASYRTTLQPGVHALYFHGGSRFNSVRISGLVKDVTVCTDDIQVGRPVPRTEVAK